MKYDSLSSGYDAETKAKHLMTGDCGENDAYVIFFF